MPERPELRKCLPRAIEKCAERKIHALDTRCEGTKSSMKTDQHTPNSVLFIAYYFPPEGNAAVYRPLRFLKQLALRGCHTTVICCQPYQYERYDPELLSQV